MVTLANCPPDPVRQAINQVVAAAPRIARTADGGLALVSRVGTLRLARSSARAFGTGVQTRLRSGWGFDLLGEAGGQARLTLGPGDRFSVALACGTFDGRWRSDPSGQARFSPGRLPIGCESDEAAIGMYNFFTGDLLAAVGPNRDIALFVSRGRSLAARLVQDAAR